MGRGPQGDVIRINNLVRCVHGGVDNIIIEENALCTKSWKAYEENHFCAQE